MELHHGNRQEPPLLSYTVEILDRQIVVGTVRLYYEQLTAFNQFNMLTTDDTGTWLQMTGQQRILIAVAGPGHGYCVAVLMSLFKCAHDIFDRHSLPPMWTNVIHPQTTYCCNNDPCESYRYNHFTTTSSKITSCRLHASNHHHFHYHHHHQRDTTTTVACPPPEHGAADDEEEDTVSLPSVNSDVVVCKTAVVDAVDDAAIVTTLPISPLSNQRRPSLTPVRQKRAKETLKMRQSRKRK